MHYGQRPATATAAGCRWERDSFPSRFEPSAGSAMGGRGPAHPLSTAGPVCSAGVFHGARIGILSKCEPGDATAAAVAPQFTPTCARTTSTTTGIDDAVIPWPTSANPARDGVPGLPPIDPTEYRELPHVPVPSATNDGQILPQPSDMEPTTCCNAAGTNGGR